MKQLRKEDDILSAILLHDVLEVTDLSLKKLPVNEATAQAIGMSYWHPFVYYTVVRDAR